MGTSTSSHTGNHDNFAGANLLISKLGSLHFLKQLYTSCRTPSAWLTTKTLPNTKKPPSGRIAVLVRVFMVAGARNRRYLHLDFVSV